MEGNQTMSKNVNHEEPLFSLAGKTIVITGAMGLLGRKHVEAIAEFGGTPILLDLKQQPINSFVLEINEKYGCDARGYAVDITDEAQIIENIGLIQNDFGCLHGLINNAASNPKVECSDGVNFSRLENFPRNVWDNELNISLTGAFLCAKHYGKMIASNGQKNGVIINISSDLGIISPDQRLYSQKNTPKNEQWVKPVTYSVSKAGIIGLTKYLATYWLDEGVRCNAICPGGVYNGQPKEFTQKIIDRIPLGRMANADEYKGTIIWMLSNASTYLNGAVVTVDGGRTSW